MGRKTGSGLLSVALVLTVGGAFAGSQAWACSDCVKTDMGWESKSGCCCSCTNTQGGGVSLVVKCDDGQEASCKCEPGGSASGSCHSPKNKQVRSTSVFYKFVLSPGNLRTVGRHIQGLDKAWQFVLARGFDGGTPISKEYVWESGVDLAGALRTIAADFGACSEVDYDNRTIVFGPAGTCP